MDFIPDGPMQDCWKLGIVMVNLESWFVSIQESRLQLR